MNPKGRAVARKRPAVRCTAKRKNGQPCKNYAIAGLDKCKFHCGKRTEVAKEEGKQNLALAKVASLIERHYGGQRIVDPLQELLDVIWLDAAMTAMLRSQVLELNAVVGKNDSFAGPDHLGDAAPHVFVVELRRWSDQLARHCKIALEAGVAERQVKIAERQGEAIIDAIEAVLDSLKLSAAQRETARKVVGAKLRVLSGTAA